MPARPHWWPAYIGIGSNLDTPEAHVRRAFDDLAALRDSRCMARSALYRSAPLGPAAQPDYINAVAGLLTQLPASALLAELQRIEHAHGRRRTGERWGPRKLDLDLLVYAGERRDTPRLSLPHPRIAERNFVLLPLAEIAPHLEVPGLGSVTTLCGSVQREHPPIEPLDR